MEDCIALQSDLDNIFQWCLRNRLYLNILKCLVVSYSRKKSTLCFQYLINNTNLKRVMNITDLGILFDEKFTFVPHINQLVAKAHKIYGFIYRNGKDFTKVQTLKILFFALVRSQLEYGSIVWQPIYQVHINRIESVQRMFLKFLSYCEDGVYPQRGVHQSLLLNRFNINSLFNRRITAGVKFIINLINNKIDNIWLTGKLNFLVPRHNSRQREIFYCPLSNSNIHVKSPIISMCKVCNRIFKTCDLTDNFSVILNVIIQEYGI